MPIVWVTDCSQNARDRTMKVPDRISVRSSSGISSCLAPVALRIVIFPILAEPGSPSRHLR
jgi:hypothetical protein